MFLLYFVNAFQSSITGSLSAYIVSSFSAHSLIPTIGIVSNVMSAATYMPLAKALNLWDRSYGFAFMTLLSTIGLILSATCKNIYVYCASQVRLKLFISNAISRKLIKYVGVLLYRFRRYDFRHRCHHCGHFSSQRSRSRLRLHFFSLHHHGLCWFRRV